jgi:hypothetical protein
MHKRGREFDIAFVDRACTGDCDDDNAVTIGELVTGVNISLGNADISRCSSFDRDESGGVDIAELVAAVGFSISGCP